MDYAILVSLATREEAEVAAAALRADGVDAFVGDTNHLGMNWFYTLALGGLQILVPRDRLEEARELLRERILENAEAYYEERIGRRDRWKVWLIAIYAIGPTVTQLPALYVAMIMDVIYGY
jgi:hypothetical protein